MINVSNEPIPEQDWEQFRKFLPNLKSFRYTENPRFVEYERKYRICYTATVEDANTLHRFLQGLEDARVAAEKEWYKSLSLLGKIKYKLQKSKNSRQSGVTFKEVSENYYLRRKKDRWWHKYTY